MRSFLISRMKMTIGLIYNLKTNIMNKEQYFEFQKEFFKQCQEISQKKNSDYTGASDDPFANFTTVEKFGIKTEQGFVTRMSDKLKRISSFVEKGTLEVKDESALDTLQDLANYCCLFSGYLKSEKDKRDSMAVKAYCEESREKLKKD